ncbi:hypothetical protein ACFXTO_036269 [Malus domestica]
MIAFSKIEEASFSESREPDTTDHFFKGKCEGYKEACGDKRNSTRADTPITLSKAKVSHISRSALYSGGNQKTLQLSSRISLWGEGEQSVGALIAYLVCHLFQQTP